MINFTLLGKWGIRWPIFGLIFCVISSLIVDFHAMTDQPCGAPNLLPSLSSAIGQFKPQTYMWRTYTCFVTGIRFLAGMCYFYWYMRIPINRFRWLYKSIVGLAHFTYTVEIGSRLGLSAISIEDNGAKHELFFKTFLAHGQMYMLLTIIVIVWTYRSGAVIPTWRENKMLIFRVLFLFINIYCAKEAWAHFYRHRETCDAYGYTKFALCEYLAITMNILNHSFAIIDLRRYSFVVVPTKEITAGRFKNANDLATISTFHSV